MQETFFRRRRGSWGILRDIFGEFLIENFRAFELSVCMCVCICVYMHQPDGSNFQVGRRRVWRREVGRSENGGGGEREREAEIG